MKIKIESLVSSCNQCRFMKEFKSSSNSINEYVAICEYIDNETHELKKYMALALSNSHVIYRELPIPENCPLEDYGPSN